MSDKNKSTIVQERQYSDKIIIVAGATGVLGSKIVKYLLSKGAKVRALVRKGSSSKLIPALKKAGAEIVEVDYDSIHQLKEACIGGYCVVSSLSGLREVIVDMQTNLVKGAVQAGVPRFIPSDFSIDFTKLPPGTNRNLDLRREFSGRLERQPIAATSILNGMFTDLLKGEAPIILTKIKKVMYWGDPDQPLDFTTIEDTARFTAEAALDQHTPRYLQIAGDVSTIRELQKTTSEAKGVKYGLLRLGGLPVLKGMIKLTKLFSPSPKEIYPPWQGMQYLHNMLSGEPKINPLDNGRYSAIRWTSIKQVLSGEV